MDDIKPPQWTNNISNSQSNRDTDYDIFEDGKYYTMAE